MRSSHIYTFTRTRETELYFAATSLKAVFLTILHVSPPIWYSMTLNVVYNLKWENNKCIMKVPPAFADGTFLESVRCTKHNPRGSNKTSGSVYRISV